MVRIITTVDAMIMRATKAPLPGYGANASWRNSRNPVNGRDHTGMFWAIVAMLDQSFDFTCARPQEGNVERSDERVEDIVRQFSQPGQVDQKNADLTLRQRGRHTDACQRTTGCRAAV